MDRIDYDLKLDSVKRANKALKVKSINAKVEEHISKEYYEAADHSKSSLDIVAEKIPVWIDAHHFKTVADTERIYHYEHGVYLDDGEKVLKALIEAEFGDITTDTIVRDAIGKVKRRTYVDRDAFNNQHLLNVKNGLINLDTLELKPHTPDYLSTAQLDVTYTPLARSPKIRTFLREVAQSGNIALIEEIVGWLLWPDYHIHKAVMLLGPGRNGKGTLLRLLTAFLGGRNVCNVTLQDLVSDRFAKADLYGKLANIGGDLPSKDLSDTAAFRNLTGGDDVRAQEKYKTAFGFRNKAKMIFSANVLPRSPDDTYAFYARWILIEFLNTFTVESGTADPDLDAKLQTSDELSGLLNIALDGLKRLRANGWKFSYEKTVEDVEIMYKRNANPVYAFLIDECEPGGATDYIEKTLFYNKFKEYAETHGLRPLSVTKFGELLKDQTEIPVSTFRPWIEHGHRPMCWQGVKFQSTPSRVKPTPSLAGEKEKEKGIDEEKREGYSKVGLKQTIDGVDCGKEDGLTIGPNPRKDEPTPKGGGPMPEHVCYRSKLRAYAITEFGMNGWVDPNKLAIKMALPVDLVCRGLEYWGYVQYDRTGGGLAFTQPRAEAST
jgi:P4 family phage/plasmid primase-like protien